MVEPTAILLSPHMRPALSLDWLIRVSGLALLPLKAEGLAERGGEHTGHPDDGACEAALSPQRLTS